MKVTGVLIRDQDTDTGRGVTMWGHREEMAIHTPRREAWGEAAPRRQDLGLQPPEQNSKCLWFQPSSSGQLRTLTNDITFI